MSTLTTVFLISMLILVAGGVLEAAILLSLLYGIYWALVALGGGL